MLVIPQKSSLKKLYSLQEETPLAKRIEIKDLGAERLITGNIEISWIIVVIKIKTGFKSVLLLL